MRSTHLDGVKVQSEPPTMNSVVLNNINTSVVITSTLMFTPIVGIKTIYEQTEGQQGRRGEK